MKKKPKREKLNKNKLRRGENLSFYDIKKLMVHDCYGMVKDAIRRAR
ncbi:hypothetical protein AB8U03_16240 [Clostridium sp. Mt-5]|uniref:Uncharacterized protein n=1 Tax=Clostridium moutaii TaxID=3240932 RepID=A0ABV4BSF6_9CLOT